MRNLIKIISFFILTVTMSSQAIAQSAQQKCQSRQNIITGRYTSCTYRAKSGLSKTANSKKCNRTFDKTWKNLSKKFARQDVTCFDAPVTSSAYKTYIATTAKDTTTLLGRNVKNLNHAQRRCRAEKTLKVGSYASCRSRAESKLAKFGNNSAYNQMIGRCEESFSGEWQRIVNKTEKHGATCYDDSRPIGEYKSTLDTQTKKIAAVLAGKDLFDPISISISGSPLTLDAGGTSGSITISNNSNKGTAANINADFSGTALLGNVTVSSNTCESLAPGDSCTITLKTENSIVVMTSFTVKGSNTTEVDGALTITAPPSVISLTSSPLALTNGGSSGVISITNTSFISTAKNIKADFTGTGLAGKVSETSNTCTTVAPGTGCTISFTPGSADVVQTTFTIKGDDTNTLSAAISITTPPPTTAVISVTGSPLQLEANGPTGVLTITNTSGVVTALSIISNFTGTALDGNVTETGNTCASVPPSASCTLTFTPGSTVVSPVSFIIQGTNTNTITASIEIESGSALNSVSASSGSASGGTGVTLTGAGLTGATGITFGGIAATSVNVVNSTTVTAVTPAHAVGAVDVEITTPAGGATLTNGFTFVTTTVGQSTFGGTIACLNGGLQNLIAATSDNSTGISWGGNGITTNATSNTDGATNTVTIVNALGANGGTPYAANLCSNYEVDSQGNTPCESGNTCYNDWFLPALNQLDCTYTNNVAIGGFTAAEYWSSVEDSPFYSWVVDFTDGSQVVPGGGKGGGMYRVRCIRAFTP